MASFSYSNIWDGIINEDSDELPTLVNYIIPGGSDFSDDITIEVNSFPASIAGATFLFNAKTDPSLPDSSPSIEFNWTGIDILKYGQPTGRTYLTLTRAQTLAMMNAFVGKWFYEVKIISGVTIATIQSGNIEIIKPVSTRTS